MSFHADTETDPIAAKEAEIADMRHRLEIAEAELRGMRVIADRLPPDMGRVRRSGQADGGAGAPLSTGYRGGRQPGAISNTWKAILRDAWRTFGDAGFSESSLIKLAERHGIHLKPSDARNRMLSYKEHHYVVESGDLPGTWLVTENAAKRFSFFEPETETAPNRDTADAV